MHPDHETDAPRDWWDRVTDPQPGDDGWERVDRPQRHEVPDPRFHPRARPGETWHERMLRKRAERLSPGDPNPAPWTPVAKPFPKPSKRAREVVQALPRQSRKPGGKSRDGQRSGDRKIAVPDIPVFPETVLGVFQRRWRGKFEVTLAWRMRGLAVIAVAMSLPRGTTIGALCRMLPREVLQLSMPLPAWRWVLKWLGMRYSAFREASDHQPWLTWLGSNGMPRQISWAATRTLDRADLPGWRLSKLMQSGWGGCVPRVPLEVAARRLLPPDSWLRDLAASSRHRTA